MTSMKMLNEIDKQTDQYFVIWQENKIFVALHKSIIW